ncbi:class II fructose-bisphosphate aldolase [Enemella sp. A6]|uniref:class II fructose-bisphosphate aldolase n=1 Tax=Enemella sp. A6 TaxID=3440152 RepID=UPI003EBE11DD
MIIGLSEALDYAEKNQCGLAAVNTPFFAAVLGTIEVGEATGVPIILQYAQVHEPLAGIENMGPAMVALAERSEAPFVLHVDHGEDIDYIRKGLDLGFNSCMIDGSHHDFDENVRITREVVEMAHERGAGVEGEIGILTGNENGDPSQGIADETLYTDPEQAAAFVEATGVDCLAASFGTVHGVYHQEPNLNFELISELRERTGVPVVMHGGSGLSDDDYRESTRRGVRKINYYTYAAKAALDAARPLVADPDVVLWPSLDLAAREAVRDDVMRFVKTLANKN